MYIGLIYVYITMITYDGIHTIYNIHNKQYADYIYDI